MSNIVSTKKYVDPITKESKFAVFALFADDSVEPIKVVDSIEEAQEFERKLLGEQEKQSND